MNRDQMVTTAMIAWGDFANIGEHFLTPFIEHNVATGCVICGNSGMACEKKRRPHAVEMEHLLVAATSNDLDLEKTGADSVRQLFVLGNDDFNRDFASVNDQLLLRFIADLTLHVGYLYQSLKPLKQEALQLKYHSLVLFFIALDEEKNNTSEWKLWIKRVLNRSERTVIIAPIYTTRLWNECLADEMAFARKTSMIYFHDLQSLLRILLHTSMMTKHRVSVDDIRRIDKDDTVSILPSLDRPAYLFF